MADFESPKHESDSFISAEYDEALSEVKAKLTDCELEKALKKSYAALLFTKSSMENM